MGRAAAFRRRRVSLWWSWSWWRWHQVHQEWRLVSSIFAGLLSAWAMVSLTRILRGRPWAWRGEQGWPSWLRQTRKPSLIHIIWYLHTPEKLGVAGLPGVGEDPGVERFFAAFA